MSVTVSTSAPLLGEPLPVEFMNTIWADRNGIHDALATPSDVQGWLRSATPLLEMRDELRGWLAAPPAREIEETANRLRELRDALRRLAATQTADPRERAASATDELDQALRAVNSAAASAPHWSRLEWLPGADASREVRTHAPPGGAIGAIIAEQAIDLFAGDTRQDLRACLAPGCVLYFVKQHPRREWCSSACGNRARAARHYARHRADSST